jgi:replicative DNA helicase
MSDPTKLPIPTDVDAEAAVIGALLYDQRHVAALPPKLRPEAFFSEAHRQVFEAVCDVRDSGADVNKTTVLARIRAKGLVSKLPGGSAYVDELIDSVPVLSASTFESMAGIILDRATQRTTLLVLQRAMARLSNPALEDLPGALGDLEREIIGVSLQAHDGGTLKPIREALREEFTEWMEQAQGRGKPGTPTGFEAYDSITGGLHRSDLVIVAARPGMGKTSFATGAAIGVAKRGETVGIFSLEMSARQLAGRMLCTEARVPVSATRQGRIPTERFTDLQMALGDLATLGIHIDDASKGRPYVADIVSRARRLASEAERQRKRLGLIVVDYLQLVKPREVLVKQRHDLAVGEVSTELKSLAKELDVTVIGLAQLNRGVEQRQDKRPVMSDLRDSGQLEQDADQIVMLYRDEVYNANSSDKGIVEIIFAKNRHGVIGTRSMRFHGPTTRFYDDPLLLARDDAEAAE